LLLLDWLLVDVELALLLDSLLKEVLLELLLVLMDDLLELEVLIDDSLELLVLIDDELLLELLLELDLLLQLEDEWLDELEDSSSIVSTDKPLMVLGPGNRLSPVWKLSTCRSLVPPAELVSINTACQMRFAGRSNVTT